MNFLEGSNTMEGISVMYIALKVVSED